MRSTGSSGHRNRGEFGLAPTINVTQGPENDDDALRPGRAPRHGPRTFRLAQNRVGASSPAALATTCRPVGILSARNPIGVGGRRYFGDNHKNIVCVIARSRTPRAGVSDRSTPGCGRNGRPNFFAFERVLGTLIDEMGLQPSMSEGFLAADGKRRGAGKGRIFDTGRTPLADLVYSLEESFESTTQSASSTSPVSRAKVSWPSSAPRFTGLTGNSRPSGARAN
jgi:hypothetical protein